MNAPMRTPVVKSSEIFLFAKHTFIDAAGGGRRNGQQGAHHSPR